MHIYTFIDIEMTCARKALRRLLMEQWCGTNCWDWIQLCHPPVGPLHETFTWAAAGHRGSQDGSWSGEWAVMANGPLEGWSKTMDWELWRTCLAGFYIIFRFLLFILWIFRGSWKSLCSREMESGSESNQHQKRKTVTHGLEDQKRVSDKTYCLNYWRSCKWQNSSA